MNFYKKINEGLNDNQKRVLKLDEQKEELQELKTLLESQGEIAEKNSEYRKKSLNLYIGDQYLLSRTKVPAKILTWLIKKDFAITLR